MNQELFVQHSGKWQGPFSSDVVKRLAAEGKISKNDLIRDGQHGTTALANRVKGLWSQESLRTQQVVRRQVQKKVVRTHDPSATVAESATIPCPFCGEVILAAAKKCKHCHESVDSALEAPLTTPHAAQPVNVVRSTTVVHETQKKRWSRVIAALLSLIIPGMGQIYKGQILNGIVWAVLTAAAYLFFIPAGVVLHAFSVCGAMMGNNSYRTSGVS